MKKGERKINKERIKIFVDERGIVNPSHVSLEFGINWRTAMNYLKELESDGSVTCIKLTGGNTRTLWRSKKLDAPNDGKSPHNPKR